MIRAFEPRDIPAVVALRQQVFRWSERRSTGRLAEYFEWVFFHNPWFDPELPSHVHENDAGRVEPYLVPTLAARRARFERQGPWMLHLSARPELLAAIDRGEAFLSRLEGEWWMSF